MDSKLCYEIVQNSDKTGSLATAEVTSPRFHQLNSGVQD